MRTDREEREFLARAAAMSPGAASLLPAAVLLARTECPDADPGRVETIVERLGAEARRSGGGEESAKQRARVLAELLAGKRGLRGSREDYDDPRNSCPECALDRRRGIPLTLSLIWMETARRAGWKAEGVGLPGHFVVRVLGAGGDAVLVDPFDRGAVLGKADLRQLLHAIHGKHLRLSAADLAGLGPREILLRMLRNLRGCYRGRGDRERALAVAEDMLLLAPGLPEALRDRGLLRIDGGERTRGLADLREFLEKAPEAQGSDAVHRLVAVLTDDAEMPN